MDMIFCEKLDFRLPAQAVVEAGIAFSRAETAEKLAAAAGIELIDYGILRVNNDPVTAHALVQLRSRSWAENLRPFDEPA